MAGEFILKSGSGGSKQFVDEDQRAYTFSTIESEEQHAVNNGRAWNINTGDIALAADTATLYIKNTGTKPLVVTTFVGIASYAADATGATDNIKFEVIRNVSTGTLIESTPTDLVAENRNGGFTTPIQATIYKAGASGDTITDGTTVIQSRHNPATRLALAIPYVIPQGATVGIRITEPTGNTSMNYMTAIVLFERELIGPRD